MYAASVVQAHEALAFWNVKPMASYGIRYAVWFNKKNRKPFKKISLIPRVYTRFYPNFAVKGINLGLLELFSENPFKSLAKRPSLVFAVRGHGHSTIGHLRQDSPGLFPPAHPKKKRMSCACIESVWMWLTTTCKYHLYIVTFVEINMLYNI